MYLCIHCRTARVDVLSRVHVRMFMRVCTVPHSEASKHSHVLCSNTNMYVCVRVCLHSLTMTCTNTCMHAHASDERAQIP